MSVQTQTSVRKGKLDTFKTLMINHNGFIQEIRDHFGNDTLVSVVYRFDRMENYTAFERDWRRVNTPITEIETPWYKKMYRKASGRLKGALR